MGRTEAEILALADRVAAGSATTEIVAALVADPDAWEATQHRLELDGVVSSGDPAKDWLNARRREGMVTMAHLKRYREMQRESARG